MKSCPHCQEPVTFRGTLKQFTPLNYRCSQCEKEFLVSAPGLGLMYKALLVFAFLFSLILYYFVRTIGIDFIGPLLIVGLLVFVGCMYGVYNRISASEFSEDSASETNEQEPH